MYYRKKTEIVKIGSVEIGGDRPIAIQAMTNTDTENITKTVEQIKNLVDNGAEIVRVTVNTEEAGKAIKKIKEQLLGEGYLAPIVGDFHFNGHRILQNSDCGKYLDKYRINPGNVGKGTKKDTQFTYLINVAKENNKPIRIGVNWGSLDQELLKNMLDANSKLDKPLHIDEIMHNALIKSALDSAFYALELGLTKNQIVISCKVSNVRALIKVYEELSLKCDFPLHLGLTEAGMGIKGVTSSAIAISSLLLKGIGDTIRVSLTPKPNQERKDEVIVAKEILQSLGMRSFSPSVTACPGCGRTTSTYFQELALQIQEFLDFKMHFWKISNPKVVNMKVAVMGCVVNGPGESKLANIGISLPGKDETPVAPVFVDGVHFKTLKGNNIISDFKEIVEEYVNTKYT